MKSIVFALLGLFVIMITSCSDEPTTPQEEHFEPLGMNIYAADTIFMRIFKGTIDPAFNQKFIISDILGPEYNIVFLDEDGHEMEAPDDEEKNLGWVFEDNSIAKLNQDSNKWSFRLEGLKNGTTKLELQVLHLDHPDFRTPQIEVLVGYE
jgi:hypothetical protein